MLIAAFWRRTGAAARPAQPAPRPAAPAPAPAPAGRTVVASLFPQEAAPADGALGVPIYPNAQFLTSYDAGRGQRYYLYGATGSFVELVAYYRTLLKNKGTPIFESLPPGSSRSGDTTKTRCRFRRA